MRSGGRAILAVDELRGGGVGQHAYNFEGAPGLAKVSSPEDFPGQDNPSGMWRLRKQLCVDMSFANRQYGYALHL